MAKKKEPNYLDNLAKEFRQFLKAKAIANESQFRDDYFKQGYAGTSKAAQAAGVRARKDVKRDLKKERNSVGQLAGAALQGRRYKGNKQVKKSK
jgi:hypothetical protein